MVLKTGPGHGKSIRAVAFVLAVVLAGFFCLSAWAPETDAEKGKAGGIIPVSSGRLGDGTCILVFFKLDFFYEIA